MVQKLVFQHIIFRHMYSSETQSFAMKYRLKIKFYFETLSTSEQEVIPLTEEVFFTTTYILYYHNSRFTKGSSVEDQITTKS